MKQKFGALPVIILTLLALTSLACNLNLLANQGPATEIEAPPPATTEAEPDTPIPPPPTDTPAPAPPTDTPLPPTEEAPAETGQPEEAAPTQEPGQQPPASEPTEETTAGETIESLQLPGLGLGDGEGKGLLGLTTYRQQLMVRSVSGTEEVTGFDYRADVNTAQKAIHAYVTVTGPAAVEMAGEQMEFILIEDELWVKIGKQPWLPVPKEMGGAMITEQMVSAGDLLPFVPQANRVMPDEEINGVMARHYRYELNNFQTENVTLTGSGDVYVAVDGGYVVRWTFSGQGKMSHETANEKVDIEYNTLDVGAPIDIQPPR